MVAISLLQFRKISSWSSWLLFGMNAWEVQHQSLSPRTSQGQFQHQLWPQHWTMTVVHPHRDTFLESRNHSPSSHHNRSHQPLTLVSARYHQCPTIYISQITSFFRLDRKTRTILPFVLKRNKCIWKGASQIPGEFIII